MEGPCVIVCRCFHSFVVVALAEAGAGDVTVGRWQARYEEHGGDWLLDPVPGRPAAMPNQTPLEAELAIVDDALAHPKAGPRTIAAALRAQHRPQLPDPNDPTALARLLPWSTSLPASCRMA